ncbi:MAG TPA: PQQ-binding-like beta-propeller repeat protein [Verrucomicrobiae bacterium]|nr:PQQ-binding-like beta-propeller repeat protein [Verrucomicrobiae bacterium]
MEIFGFVCSAFCRAKAEAQNMDIPQYENQKTVSEARFGRKVSLYALSIAAVVVLLGSAWIWWEWIATMPKPMFSKKFPQKAFSGQARLTGPNQLVVLHGGTLARFDLKTKNEVWSKYLLDKSQIATGASAALEQMKVSRKEAIADGADSDDLKIPSLEELTESMIRSAEESLALHTHADNVWVKFQDKLVRYDWQNGTPGKEIALTGDFGHWVAKGSELVSLSEKDSGGRVFTHLDLASGEIKEEEFARPKKPEPPALTKGAGIARSFPSTASGKVAALPTKLDSNQLSMAARLMTNQAFVANYSKSGNKPLDPKEVAKQYQNLPLSTKLALPAVIAANANQQRLAAELRGESDVPLENVPFLASRRDDVERTTVHRAAEGFAELSVKLLKQKSVEVKVMKAAPKKSVTDGELTTGNSMAAANELLNEMQRERFGDSVKEDISTYRVRLKKQGGTEEWSGEVTGEPQFFGLKTLNLLVAGDSLFVFDKDAKKLWEGKLSSKVPGGDSNWDDSPSIYGDGPCIERGERLYIFDQTVLTAYEKSTGKVQWRLPSVGTAGLFFDEQGSVYVNTTTADLDSVRYSMQIDVTRQTRSQVIKLQESTGKVLWRADGEGMVNYVSGKFVYTTEIKYGDLEEASFLPDIKTGLEIPPHVQIKRLSPRNGRVLWEHYQKRAPLDVQFDGNRIQLLFRKELQVLSYMSM